ncbi:MAG: DUF4292 domain-containing protein [Bacteroidota bacterium]
MSKYLFPVFLLSILMFGACKSTKPLVQVGELADKSSDTLVQFLVDRHIDVEWLSAKAKISFKDNSQSRKATANIRLRKDSVLWMNVKKLGIEAARILITPDSIYIVDRIHKEYAIGDFSLVQQQYHLPANFDLLQNMILGNPLLLSGVKLQTAIVEDQYHLASSNDENPTRDYWLSGLNHVLEKMIFLDFRNNRKVQVELSDYKALDEYEYFSYFRRLNLSSPETGDLRIDIDFSKIELNKAKTIRFEIPKHYTRIN